jgi:hypothetical protein
MAPQAGFIRVFKNKHQAVSQGVRRFGKRSPPAADEHLQKPHNAGSRPQAQFFNTLIGGGRISEGTACGGQRSSHRLCLALAAVKTKIPESSLFQAALVIRAADVAGRRVFLPDDRHFNELGAFFHGIV